MSATPTNYYGTRAAYEVESGRAVLSSAADPYPGLYRTLEREWDAIDNAPLWNERPKRRRLTDHEWRMARAARIARCRAHIHVLKECVAQSFCEATLAGVVLGVRNPIALLDYWERKLMRRGKA